MSLFRIFSVWTVTVDGEWQSWGLHARCPAPDPMLETLPHRADTKLVPVLLLLSTVTLASHFTSLGLELALPDISQED